MQTDSAGASARVEIAPDGVGQHRVQFSKGVALRRDTASSRVVPASDESASFRTRLDQKGDFGLGHSGVIGYQLSVIGYQGGRHSGTERG